MPLPRKYSAEDLSNAVAQSLSIAQVLRILGIKPAGGSHHHISQRIKRADLDTSHFTGQGHNAGKRIERKSADHFLVQRPPNSRRLDAKYLRRSLIEIGVPLRCEQCGLGDQWRGFALCLQVDHRDGDSTNCRAENLRFLCPNCHSQTPTFCKPLSMRETKELAP